MNVTKLFATLFVVGSLAVAGCPADPGPQGTDDVIPWDDSADGWTAAREVEVILTEPHCDVCTQADKDVLRARSRIIARVVELIDGAQETIDIGQFTFSVREIEEALLRAHARGVTIRLAMNSQQDSEGTVARRLRDAGLDVRFVAGRPPRSEGAPGGLQHAKFMIVDGRTLATGSNNWSSTGTTINNENTIVIESAPNDPLLVGFTCHFDAIWESDIDAAGQCSSEGMAFAPSSAPIRLIRDEIRAARRSVDVLMHHLLFDDLVKVLAQAAERGVRVRVIVNAADRDEISGRQFERLLAAGGEIRFKQTNESLYQIMHDKLVIIDDRVLINGSGNWSGSAFFNNFENYVRYCDPRVVEPFVGLFARLWSWSLTADALDRGLTAAEQHVERTGIYFGNLHAHIHAEDGDRLLDDGHADVLDDQGQRVPVEIPATVYDAARYAFEYARDRGDLDFMALSPHTVGEGWDVPRDTANMTPQGYQQLVDVAALVTDESGGAFAALPSMEWSTNGSGNHVNILGSAALSTVERGRFDLLYEEFLPQRAWAGDRPFLMFNHPRTMRLNEEYLTGNWDQIFGVNLQDLPTGGQRNAKFNDYGLDDYPPLSEVREDWIQGLAMPNQVVVDQTLENIRQVTSPYLRLMEVTVARGNELGGETPVNPSLTVLEDGTTERFTRVHEDWDYYLLRGFRLAPTASHDCHYANWGAGHTSRTAVLAEELSEAGILEAIDRRAVYASEDQNLALRFYAEDRVPMGGELRTIGASVSLDLQITDPDYDGPVTVRIYQGRVGGSTTQVIWEVSAGPDRWYTVEAPVADTGEYFYYLEVHEVDADRMAWSAPIWVERI